MQARVPCMCGGLVECEVCEGSGLEQLHRCPRSLVVPEYSALIDVFSWAEKGQLPVDGALLDQPAWFVQAFPLFKSELEDARQRWHDEAQADAERRQRSG